MPEALNDRPSLQRRLLRPADFGAALELLPPWLGLDEAQRAALPALWGRLLHHPGFNADAIEDMTAPPGQQLQALGMSIALDAAWQQRLRGEPAPRLLRPRGGVADPATLAAELVRQGVAAAGPQANDLYDRIVGLVEGALIRQVLAACDQVQIKAAARLGINRNTLHKKLQEHRLAGGGEAPATPAPEPAEE